MDNYNKLFSSNIKEKGKEIYNNKSVLYVLKYDNIYYSKVLDNNDDCSVCINNKKFECSNCNKLCKHSYATLLSITNNNYSININDLPKEDLLNMIHYCIKKNDDDDILDNINIFISKNKLNTFYKNTINTEVKDFFNNFEENHFNYIENNNKNYIKEYNNDNYHKIYNDCDNELINLLKTITENNDLIYKFVGDKIKYYNNIIYNSLYEINSIFQKTLKYLENPNNFYNDDDIIKLFENNYDLAVVEFNKLDNLENIMYIYNNINIPDKTLLLQKKCDEYLCKNDLNSELYNCLILLISLLSDEQVIKKYGLIVLRKNPYYEIFKKIKPLCNNNELEMILEDILDINFFDDIMFDNIFNILSDYKDNNFIIDDDNDLYNYLILVVFSKANSSIIKKYGLFVLKLKPHFHTFIMIKSLCSKEELEIILNNLLKINIIDQNIFDILYDYGKYDHLYDTISKITYKNDQMIYYCNSLLTKYPEKINILLRNYIEDILDNKISNLYILCIEYIKIYKLGSTNDEFIKYTNELLVKHNRKQKFKSLFTNEFKFI
jgi:hypothetical protein